MKTKLAFVLGAIAALAITPLRSVAVEPPPIPLTEAGLAGLQVSLTTSGYKFFLAEPETPTPAATNLQKPAREWFVASALVANRSNTDIDFTFPTPAAAAVKWTFRIFNSSGVQIWQSDAGVMTPQVLTEATLDKRGRWKRLIQVPLRIEGKLLEPGTYTLEASIDADKSVEATALFEVALPPVIPVPTRDTGIKGSVLLPGDGEQPAAGALVNIIELRADASPLNRAAFVWTGRADAFGKFQVVTPAGRFRVTANALGGSVTANAIAPLPNLLPKSAEVTVNAGAFTEVTIRLAGVQPPARDTGIKGLVLFGPIKPVAVEGEPNERPLAGAPVAITEVREPGAAGERPVFQWKGMTDSAGRFSAVTPPGRFKIYAAQFPPFPGPIAPAVEIPATLVEVTVEQGKFTEATLHIDSFVR